MLSTAAIGYALVFAGLCVLDVPAVGIAAYFVIPTALVGMAGGPYAGGAGALLAAFLYMVAGRAHPRATPEDVDTAVVVGRVVALGTTGVLVGWFAARNRSLVAKLRDDAQRDHLTGLGNARFYESAVRRRLTRGDRFTLMVCDLDGLKDVNDAHGHSAGDEKLRQLAVTLRMLARPDDEIARIGGDEFCVITEATRDNGLPWALTRFEQQLEGAGCPVTFGWADFPGDADCAESLFEIADERLYSRKERRADPRVTQLRSRRGAPS